MSIAEAAIAELAISRVAARLAEAPPPRRVAVAKPDEQPAPEPR